MLFEAYNTVGELDPWTTLPDETITDMWNRVFGDIYPVAIRQDGEVVADDDEEEEEDSLYDPMFED